MNHIPKETLRLNKLKVSTKKIVNALRRENQLALAQVIEDWSEDDEVFSLTGDNFNSLAKKLGKDLSKSSQIELANILKKLVMTSINEVYDISLEGQISAGNSHIKIL